MRYAPRALLAGGLGFAVSFIVACGGGAGLLSAGNSANLNDSLDQVSSLVQSGQCSAAARAVASIGTQVAALPSSVSPKLRRNLEQGVNTTKDLVQNHCRPQIAAPKTTRTKTQTTPTKTNTTPTKTNTTPTQTQTTGPSTSTQPPATTPTSPGTTSTGSSGGVGFGGGTTGGAGPGGGNGQGNGNGNGH